MSFKRIFHKIFLKGRILFPRVLRFPMLLRVYFPWIIRHPRILPTLARLASGYLHSKRIREEELKRGLKVPPFLIISITSQCNLQCAGCYAAATGTIQKNQGSKSLNLEEWRKIIYEATELGVFGFIIAGGEPFLKHDLLKLSEEFNDRLFLIFTNGTLLKSSDYNRLRRIRNTIVIVSIEGDPETTDRRRGMGVYKKAIATIQKLGRSGVISGISVTIDRQNYKYWMRPENIDALIAKEVHLGFFLEYIPVNDDVALMLKSEEREKFRKTVLNYRETKQIFLIHSPGDEEYMGGCVSAGRGFVHITPTGDLTPCPVSNIATHNLTTSSLRDALKSPLFKLIRENEHLLETEGMPCALFAHPKEVAELVKQVGGYIASDACRNKMI